MTSQLDINIAELRGKIEFEAAAPLGNKQTSTMAAQTRRTSCYRTSLAQYTLLL
jgi:hypothetical protein